MIKKLMVALLIGTSVNQIQSMLPPEQLEIAEKHTCIGPLSAENEEFINGIMYEMDITTSVKIRKPSTRIATIYPHYTFHMYNSLYGIWYINEEWFNTLTKEERTFMVGQDLEMIRQGEKQYARTQLAVLATNLVTQIVFWYSSYKCINSYPTIFDIINNSPTKSFLLSAGASTVFAAYVSNPLTAYSIQKFDTAFALKNDQKVIRQLNCADGALSYLKKMQQTIKPLYDQDKMYWKITYESLTSRIKVLEKSLGTPY